MADEFLEHIAIGCNAVGKRIAGDLYDSAMHCIGLRRLLDPSGFEVLDIAALGARESIEDIGDEIGMRGFTSGAFTSTPIAAASSPDDSMSPMLLLFSIGTTLAGARYSATCSSPESTQVILLKSTPCSSCSTLRAHTPVVTV